MKKEPVVDCHDGFLEFGGSAETRTLDRRIKSPLLYQLSYAPDDQLYLVGRARFELTTNGLKVRCSTD